MSTKTTGIDVWNVSEKLGPEIRKKELEFREQCLSSKHISQPVGKIRTFEERWHEQPHRFFVFSWNGKNYVGSKTISDLVVKDGSPGLFCSKIEEHMVLGELASFRTSSKGVRVDARCVSLEERKEVFLGLLQDRNLEIVFPFNQLLGDNSIEIDTPAEGWFINEERARILGLGEKHLRQISLDLVQRLKGERPVIFDPACSTGEFLNTLQTGVTGSQVIGQDISPEMVEYARRVLPVVHLGDAIQSPVEDKSCDFVFFRFLNSEVVSYARSFELLDSCLRKLSSCGHAVLFGHTPIHISKIDLENRGLEVLSCNQRLGSEAAIVPYYIARWGNGAWAVANEKV